MKALKTKTLLEEAIKSWRAELKDLNHAAEWTRNGEAQYRNDINRKKELIEDATILIKEIA
jgi:hypothetical protein